MQYLLDIILKSYDFHYRQFSCNDLCIVILISMTAIQLYLGITKYIQYNAFTMNGFIHSNVSTAPVLTSLGYFGLY